MSFVIGRGRERESELVDGRIGTYRAVDGSEGAPLYLDFDSPHAMLVVGKRGYGKSYTLGVIAELLASTEGVAPVILDPMGVFDTLTDSTDEKRIPAAVIENPTVTPDSLDPRSWCSLLGVDPESGAGSLLWSGAQDTETLSAMRDQIVDSNAPAVEKRAARNYLGLAQSWDIFDAAGLDAETLATSELTVLDLSGLDAAPMNAVCRAVCEALYRARIENEISRLPWVLLDEVHAFFEGIAHDALTLLLTRGRAPGVSLVAATQRPSAVPDVAISQSDILISHRLTAGDDLEALQAAQPTYLHRSLDERLPTEPGEVVIVDDATETVHSAQIRERKTPHGGESPSVADLRGF